MAIMPPELGDSAAPGMDMGGGGQAPMPQGQPSPFPPQGEPGGMMPPEDDMGMEMEGQDPEDQFENVLDFALRDTNIARKLKNKKLENGSLLLDVMGAKVVEGYEKDEDSRREWMSLNREWLKMAMLVRENKTYPWPKAANIKYPLLATAAMQFSARAYPALVPADGKVVKAKVIPADPDGRLSQKAQNIARHMSYQVMCKIPNWEEDMDKLLMTMAISGICFKKTYYNSFDKVINSHLVYPEDFCVSYWTRSLEKAYRKTEILYYNKNKVKEKVLNNEEFLDIEYGEPTSSVIDEAKMAKDSTGYRAPDESDETTPHVFLCCHTFWDLDDDGYEEPYVITVHKATKKVVRIIARWESDGYHTDEKGKVLKIEPLEYFTAYPFIPNPDGSIYAVGFGLLLGPLNEAINSNINQLTDAGTLNNMQSGFIGKGLRVKIGIGQWQPGEWKVVNATGEDIQKQMVLLPSREPSSVLMALLQMLITSGNQLASIAEIMVGKMPGQNTPATTTQETVKQGMAVFTAIYKRVYRSLESEFRKIHCLNRITPNIVEEEAEVLGLPLSQSDYDDEELIIPGGDPTGDSESTKQAKQQQVAQLIQLGTIDPMQFTIWSCEIGEIPNYQKLLKQPQPPQPDPKAQALQMKAQLDEKKAQSDIALKEREMQMKAEAQQQELEFKKQLEIIKIEGERAKQELEQTRQAMDLQGQRMQLQMDMLSRTMEQRFAAQKGQQDVMHARVSGEQKLAQSDAAFKQKQAQQRGNGKAMSSK